LHIFVERPHRHDRKYGFDCTFRPVSGAAEKEGSSAVMVGNLSYC
jgi:hypothetical protein